MILDEILERKFEKVSLLQGIMKIFREFPQFKFLSQL